MRQHCLKVSEANPGRGEDRVAVVPLPGRLLIAVADGAGGTSGGAAAAEHICAALARGVAASWVAWLEQVDLDLAASPSGGLAAAVVVEVGDDGSICGASVGDCEAWIFGQGPATCLTGEQIRKPLLGSGGAMATAFSAKAAGGRLIVATDGLWKYANLTRIREAAHGCSLDAAVDAMIAGVRLRSGALQDDVAIVACDP